MFAFVLLALLAAPVQEQWTLPQQLSLFVTHVGNDNVGRVLTLRVREEIRRSAGYLLANSEKDAAVVLKLVSVPADME